MPWSNKSGQKCPDGSTVGSAFGTEKIVPHSGFRCLMKCPGKSNSYCEKTNACGFLPARNYRDILVLDENHTYSHGRM